MSATAITFPTTATSRSLPQTLRIFLTETRYEFLRLLRTRSFALSVIGFPVVFYIFFGLIMNRGQHIGGITVARYMLAGYTVFGMVGAALFGIGVGLSAELAAGWLELKRASPMPPLAYLCAKCLSAMAFGVIIVSLLTLLGITAGGVHLSLLEFTRMIALTMVGVIPFAAMGMALALLVPASSAPGIANMIYLPMSFCGGLWIPIMFLPKVLQHFAVILPTYHLAQLQLTAFGYPSTGTALSHWIGLIGFTLLAFGVALFAFRRLEQNS
jgi:ABC-2 type transport system permease protein